MVVTNLDFTNRSNLPVGKRTLPILDELSKFVVLDHEKRTRPRKKTRFVRGESIIV
jgi:hypothetical protein